MYIFLNILPTSLIPHMNNKKEALAQALAMIEKQFGVGSVMTLGEQ